MKTHLHRLFCPAITAVAIGSSLLINAPAAEAVAPLLEKQNLFEARTNGYWTCRIPGIVVTKNNTVLVTTEARPGRGGDYDFNDVLMRRSTDGGKTFGPIVKLLDHTTYGDGPVSNFVMIPDRDSGRVAAVFCHDYARVFTMHSDDDGVTWSKPVEITPVFDQFKSDYPWRVCATGPGHGTQLRNGRMIIPVWLSDGSGKEFGKGKHRGHRPSIVAAISSDDRGTTWKRGGIVCRHGDVVEGVTVVNPSETVAVELADGRVMFNMRSESKINRRLVAVSPDGASGWTGHRWDPALLEPVCMASLIRHGWPKGRQPGRILFANPSNLENELIRPGGSLAHDRKRLTVKMSLDDGATWPVSKILEPGPAGYSDLAVLADGTILCLYEADIVTRMCDDRYVRLARFNLEWLKSAGNQASLRTVDLSADTTRQVIVAQGTETVYQGHPTTLLLPDGQTMFCVWTINHGGPCGPMKRSDDGGRTWSELLPVPENWREVKNCPSIYLLTDPHGKSRIFVFAGQGPDGTMQMSCSKDDGKTWTPMRSVNLECVMPFCTIVPIDGGKRLLGMTNIRRPGETKDKRSNVVVQSVSTDGGLTWSDWRIVLDLGELKPCEPALVRSPDGKQLLCLLRENTERVALYMTSDDEGRTWSKTKPLPAGLHGDRHMARYAPDGRLVVCFRDTGKQSPTKNHFVAWVGRYENVLNGREGQYRIKLLHSYAGGDCGYPGLDLLPDGTFVATTYVKYRPGPEKNSVVSTRFKLEETDKMAVAGFGVPASAGSGDPSTTHARLAKAGTPNRPQPAGILLDDGAGEFIGDWVESAKQPALVGKGYRHDSNREQGKKSARFTPDIKEAGDYEVRLIHVATNNRATKVPVTIISADGEKTVTVNQREDALVKGVPRALGVFKFAAGKKGSVTISNAGADGFVVVDAVQFVPAEIAKAEREGKRDAGFTAARKKHVETADEPRNKQAAAVAVSPLAPKGAAPSAPKPLPAEPVHLAKDAKPGDVDGKSYDLVVVGGTGSGVMCAVRAAREGCTVLLVQHNRHIGGMMSNGLMQWDALYGGHRAPLFTELLRNIERHYIATYGENSREHQVVRCTHEHYPISWAEAHVAEREFNRLVADEKKITLLLSHYATAVESDGAMLRSVTLREYGGAKEIRVRGAMFADGTYEGDLFALAKVPYRCGREARDEYKEPHAGKVFCNVASGPAPRDAVEGRLNIRPYGSHQGTIDPTSPFTADRAVQAYNYRFCVTKDPANRILLTAPPPGYNREEYVNYNRKSIATNAGPNSKSHMNSPILPGENHDYPEADWPAREKIIQRHLNFALGLMYFLQNDESVSPKQREKFREWGLPKDEFADNNHVPYEMYVREARRIVGRHVYTEHDNSLAPGLGRTPVHSDSIATTDWYMDSHSCTTDSRPGFHYDGKLILTEESRPGQIPYRSLLPQGVDNLLVPVCLSATHIAWGAVRLEPVWMQTGEAAGFAAALAKKQKTTPAKLDSDLLLRTLVERRQMISFFNDISVAGKEPWIPAVQYFGTKGFFHDYDAKPTAPLKRATAKVWADGLAKLHAGKLDPNALARAVADAERANSVAVTAAEFVAMLPSPSKPAEGVFTRQHAIAMMWRLIK
ncbi:MAG: FAD-dependent oxidoreductase [Verrucomicrobia bacterium]|nr:FAD-dependent oxidoreductase [Verrucomicrobiota bacterium]